MPPKIKSRKPTCVIPYPFLLIEGEEGAGKTYSAFELSASERIGQMYVVDLSEGSADEYGAIPNADYEVIEHDGTYQDIAEQVEAVREEAQRAAAAGEKPVVLVIDSGTALWRMLSNWAGERAKRTQRNRDKLRNDPDANVDVTRNLWNDSSNRWYRIIHAMQTFPGIAIILARGRDISATGEDGQPLLDDRRRVVREWKVGAQKDIGFDVSAWVRMRRDRTPELIKARTLRFRVESGNPLPLPGFSVERLVFDLLGCSTASQPRQMPVLVGDRTGPWMERIAAATSRDECLVLWTELDAGAETGLTEPEWNTVRGAVRARVAELAAPKPGMDDAPDSDAARLRAAAEAQQAEADAEVLGDPPTPAPAPAAAA
ncbi:AAA family ATPase [Kitasatospora sp. NPDC092286]|uniref:AAA family ATPase n=1 Tax=Kitasatospora sp. NPDC092286 TaxID=3364087 RepID=UPI0038165394